MSAKYPSAPAVAASEIDVFLIGSGAAGAVVAKRLTDLGELINVYHAITVSAVQRLVGAIIFPIMLTAHCFTDNRPRDRGCR